MAIKKLWLMNFSKMLIGRRYLINSMMVSFVQSFWGKIYRVICLSKVREQIAKRLRVFPGRIRLIPS